MSVTSVGQQLVCTHHTEQTCGPGPVPPDSAQLVDMISGVQLLISGPAGSCLWGSLFFL